MQTRAPAQSARHRKKYLSKCSFPCSFARSSKRGTTCAPCTCASCCLTAAIHYDSDAADAAVDADDTTNIQNNIWQIFAEISCTCVQHGAQVLDTTRAGDKNFVVVAGLMRDCVRVNARSCGNYSTPPPANAICDGANKYYDIRMHPRHAVFFPPPHVHTPTHDISELLSG